MNKKGGKEKAQERKYMLSYPPLSLNNNKKI